MTLPCTFIHLTIHRPPQEVYQYASNPENLAVWARGLAPGMKISFAPENDLGVMDHDVTLPTGEVVHNPFRVLKNGAGSEVVFTLYKQPGMKEEDYWQDITAVRDDLEKLKELLEASQ